MAKKTKKKPQEYFDPSPGLHRDRKLRFWEHEMTVIESLLTRARAREPSLNIDPNYIKYGGRITDLNKRAQHVREKLGTYEMRLAVKFRTRREELR